MVKKKLMSAYCLGMVFGLLVAGGHLEKTCLTVQGASMKQRVVSERKYSKDGSVEHEYVWEDSPVVQGRSIKKRSLDTLGILSETSQLGGAQWLTTKEKGGTVRHRAAKICPNPGSDRWYACSQTDYPKWHYSRVRIVNRVTGKVLEDSGRQEADSGIVTARTSPANLYLSNWEFAMKSYWGV